jgi:prepilin-type N-terminal cleavage/methylation domain-containing protein/prepilin-type processing-associated H-X9-DG protein
MQAIAAATFEGKPVDVDFGPGSGPGVGEGGGGIGSWSGMTYIHKIAVALSSNSATGRFVRRRTCGAMLPFFCFHSLADANIVTPRLKNLMVRNSPRAFTLIELLVVVAIIIIIVALAVPAFTRALESAKATKDMSNLRQIGMAIQTYLNDNDQILPASAIWPGTSTTPVLYQKYIATRKVFQSPFDKRTPAESDTAPVSYSINHNMYFKLGTNPNVLKIVSPSSTFLMAPNYPNAPGDPAKVVSWGASNTTNAPDLPVGGMGETTGTHNSGRKINVLFCDWHTETVTFDSSATPAPGSFKDATSPLGLKHWDPTQ